MGGNVITVHTTGQLSTRCSGAPWGITVSSECIRVVDTWKHLNMMFIWSYFQLLWLDKSVNTGRGYFTRALPLLVSVISTLPLLAVTWPLSALPWHFWTNNRGDEACHGSGVVIGQHPSDGTVQPGAPAWGGHISDRTASDARHLLKRYRQSY